MSRILNKFYRRAPNVRGFPDSHAGFLQFICLACLGLFLLAGCKQEKASAEKNGRRQEKGAPVTVCTVKKRAFEQKVPGIGTLEARQTVEVRPEVTGTLKDIAFEEGTRVKAGTLLFKIDDRKLQQQKASAKAQMTAARARLKNARRNYRRLQTLYKRDSVSEDERDTAATTFETAKAELEHWKAELALVNDRLDDTSIKAPFTGIVSDTLVDPGDFVDVGDHLATVYRTDIIEILFYVPETHPGQIKAGQEVNAGMDAYPDEKFTGTVSYVAPNIMPSTRGLLIKAEIDNQNGRLRPGAFARAAVIVNRREASPYVPEDALVPVRDGYIVYVVNENTVNKRKIKIGLRDGVLVEIRSGLEGGETIVKGGQLKISDGSKVVINERIDCSPDAAPEKRNGEDASTEGA
ncbi:MAG: efflux RND transporter periplasmic adaptor subunit [Lentisphaeria bacterium]